MIASIIIITDFLQVSMAATLDAHLQNILHVHSIQNKLNEKSKRRLRYPYSVCNSINNDCAQTLRANQRQKIDVAVDPMVHVWIELKQDSKTAMNIVLQHVGEVRSILPNGIVTASITVSSLRLLAQTDDDDIGRIEAAKPLRKMNDVSNALQSQAEFSKDNSTSMQNNMYWGMNNTRTKTGQGVIVGVIDTGIDW
jgi:hypothetical protein